jgi:hypothetical protein
MNKFFLRMAAVIVAAALVLGLGMFFTACDNSMNSSGTAPVIEEVFTSESEDNCFDEIKKSVFIVGADVWVGVVVTDPDKDVVSATFTFGKVGGSTKTETFGAEAMEGTTVIYAAPGGYFEPGDQGQWRVTVYVTDNSGHKSNSMSHTVTVQ